MWQALLGMFGGASGGAQGASEATGGATDTPMQKSDKQQAKFEASSAQRDAMLRQALMSAPMANLGFTGLAPVTGTPSGVSATGGVELGQKGGGDSILGFLKGIFSPDENDTAIPEEDMENFERESQAKARQNSRAAERAESNPQESVDFFAELQKLYTVE